MRPVDIEPLTARWFRAIVVSTAAAAGLYLAAVIWAGRTEVMAALRLLSANMLLGLLGLSLLNYGLRFVRWHYFIRSLGGRIAITHDLRIYIAGIALTTTPGKAGEMARTVWLRPYGVPAPISIASFLAERIQDVLAIVLLASLAVTPLKGGAWVLLGGVALVVVALMVVHVPRIPRAMLRFMTNRHGKMQALAAHTMETLRLTRGCFTPARFASGFTIGLCAWAAEGLVLYALMLALGHPLPPTRALGIFAFSTLAGALSFLPGGLGGTEATMIVFLRLLAIPLPIAVSATLLIQLITLWFAVLLGITALSIQTNISLPTSGTRAAASGAEQD
jgi:uncharacterized protein (TIRG00374 family)